MTPRFLAFVLTANLVLPLSAADAAEPVQTFAADYSVSFLGFTVANSRFVTHLRPDRYDIDGSIESAGLATFFERTKATAKVSGHVGKNGQVMPASYSVDYTYGKKQKKTSLSFAKGRVVDISNTPPLPPRRKDWVPVEAEQLRSVMDPISVTLVKAKDARSVCDHTGKAFDGQLLADMTLSYVGTKPVSIGGFQGDAVTCAGRFRPIAGYHRSNKSLRFLVSKSKVVVTFAQLGQTGLYAPIQASVSTRIGTVSIKAKRLEAM